MKFISFFPARITRQFNRDLVSLFVFYQLILIQTFSLVHSFLVIIKFALKRKKNAIMKSQNQVIAFFLLLLT